MIPENIQKWLTAGVFPQRVLLSSPDSMIDMALHIAAQFQEAPVEKIVAGIHSDTMVFRDEGKSFKIDFSEAAKKEGQSDHENVRGMITWAHHKPTAPHRIIILENLERVTNSAPHAMLKLIEEPPEKAIFIFTTQNHHALLDTILSRMTVIRIPSKDAEETDLKEALDFLESKDLIENFAFIEQLDKQSKDNSEKKMDRTVFLRFVDQLISVARNNEKYLSQLEWLLETHSAIRSNVTPRFVLERLAIKMSPGSECF
jgi:DNA polymerase III delta prime subunit